MKRVVGIFMLVIMCIILGLSIDGERKKDTTLVSDYELDIGGAYD